MGKKKSIDPDKLKQDLKRNKGDVIHTLTKASIATVPFTCDIVELFDDIIKSPISKRRDQWLIEIASKLKEMEYTLDNFSLRISF